MKYVIFGYQVASEIELNAYEDEFEKEDVRIELGKIDKARYGIGSGGWHFSEDGKQAVFYIRGVGAYEVSEGKRIMVDSDRVISNTEVHQWLLGSAFGLLMHQQGVFPLHGSTVEMGGTCLTLVGHTGTGKSAVAAGFIKRGFKMITDDVSRIGLIDGRYHVYPSYPSQKLWKDTMKMMAINGDPRKKLINGTDKFYLGERSRFLAESRPLEAVIEINPAEVAKPLLTRFDEQETLAVLKRHSYLQKGLEAYGAEMLQAHQAFCVSLAAAVPVYRLQRPIEGFTVGQQIKVILKVLKNGAK